MFSGSTGQNTPFILGQDFDQPVEDPFHISEK
jgi:hypothetical protein